MSDPLFEGVYGTYSIDERDRREVLGYRLALLLVALAQAALLLQWQLLGPAQLWPWLALMAAATSSHGPGLREEMVTRAPWLANCSAMAFPMPLVEPVMRAVLPLRSNSVPAALAMGCFLFSGPSGPPGQSPRCSDAMMQRF
jgi:hypothetical protein